MHWLENACNGMNDECEKLERTGAVQDGLEWPGWENQNRKKSIVKLMEEGEVKKKQ